MLQHDSRFACVQLKAVSPSYASRAFRPISWVSPSLVHKSVHNFVASPTKAELNNDWHTFDLRIGAQTAARCYRWMVVWPQSRTLIHFAASDSGIKQGLPSFQFGIAQ